MQTSSVLTELKNLITEGPHLESHLDLIMKDTKPTKQFAINKVIDTSREIGQALSKQEKITEADLNVLKEIFSMIFDFSTAKQKAYFRLQDSEASETKEQDKQVLEYLARSLDHVFRLVLTPLMESLSSDHQNIFKIGEAYKDTAFSYQIDANDVVDSNKEALAEAVSGEIQELYEAIGFASNDPRSLLLSLYKPKRGSAGQVSNFASLYFPNPKSRAPNKLSESDYQQLAAQAGTEFAFKEDENFAGNLFYVLAKHTLKQSREEIHLRDEVEHASPKSVEFFETLSKKATQNIMKPFVQEAMSESDDVQKSLSSLFFRVTDLLISTEAGSFNGDPRVVSLYNQKMHFAYREIFSDELKSETPAERQYPYYNYENPFSDN